MSPALVTAAGRHALALAEHNAAGAGEGRPAGYSNQGTVTGRWHGAAGGHKAHQGHPSGTFGPAFPPRERGAFPSKACEKANEKALFEAKGERVKGKAVTYPNRSTKTGGATGASEHCYPTTTLSPFPYTIKNSNNTNKSRVFRGERVGGKTGGKGKRG